jgi:hypothetical protein
MLSYNAPTILTRIFVNTPILERHNRHISTHYLIIKHVEKTLPILLFINSEGKFSLVGES